jgi:hypothetical protein
MTLRRKRRADPVKPDDRLDVFDRDKGCVLAWMSPGHVCMDVFGNRHAHDDYSKLTLEHVHMDGSMMGKRAPSTPDSMVTLCGLANFRVPSKREREMFRGYLRAREAQALTW